MQTKKPGQLSSLLRQAIRLWSAVLALGPCAAWSQTPGGNPPASTYITVTGTTDPNAPPVVFGGGGLPTSTVSSPHKPNTAQVIGASIGAGAALGAATGVGIAMGVAAKNGNKLKECVKMLRLGVLQRLQGEERQKL